MNQDSIQYHWQQVQEFLQEHLDSDYSEIRESVLQISETLKKLEANLETTSTEVVSEIVYVQCAHIHRTTQRCGLRVIVHISVIEEPAFCWKHCIQSPDALQCIQPVSPQ